MGYSARLSGGEFKIEPAFERGDRDGLAKKERRRLSREGNYSAQRCSDENKKSSNR